MYPVSEAFLRAVQENTRRYYWTGKITTKGGAVYPFGYEDIVKGSGYVSAQCCGSAEIELGTVYAAEMGVTLFSQIDRYTLDGAKVELFYHLRVADGSFEEVPMGIFEVSEANRRLHCLELKAYDYMLRFEKSFNGFESVGNAWAFLELCCKACGVEMENTRAEIEGMPNGRELLSIYPENDIGTYRDVLFFVGQVLGGFFCINRRGRLELRKYGAEPVMEVQGRHRFSSSFSDFITRYTAVSSTNLRTQTAEYYCCCRVRMKKALAEDTLVRLVRKQAELLLEAERALQGRQGMKEPGADAESLRAEMRRLDEAKISGYEDYKAGKLSRERFVERKRALDARRQELSAAVSETEAREIVEEAGQREYREAFRIREYLHLEGYDKRVMASLIESAKVMGEDRLEVVWKFGDVYEKILGEMR